MKRNTIYVLACSWLLSPQAMIWADSFLYTNGVFTTINPPGSADSTATAINNTGEIVGWLHPQPSGGPQYGFVDSGGVFTILNAPGGGQTTTPIGVNNEGEILVQNLGLYFYYANGVYTEIPLPGSGLTIIRGFNDSGQIVGEISVGNQPYQAFVETNGVITTISIPGAVSSSATAINDAGQIVGFYTDAGNESHGFLYSGGTISTIDFNHPGTAGTTLNGINSSGQIIGDYLIITGPPPFLVPHSILLDTNGNQTSIEVPGAQITDANGINDTGEIVGGFAPSTAIPEPASIALAAVGLALLAWKLVRQNPARHKNA